VSNSFPTTSCGYILLTTGWTESGYYVTTDGQSASLSWNKAPIWGLRPDFYYYQTFAGLLMWSTLSDERVGLLFIIAAGPRQRSHSWVWVLWDSWPYFTLSDSRLPFSSTGWTELCWILYPLGMDHTQKNIALLLLRACLLGFPCDRYPARWLLPINGHSTDPKKTPLLLLCVCLNMFTELLRSNRFFSGSIA
jgi:hypothetical protein